MGSVSEKKSGQEAVEAAIGALGRKERTITEVKEWLDAREFPDVAIDEAIDRLVESEILDDRRFAVRFAEDKRRLSGWGRRRIAEVLSRRGVAPAHVHTAVEAELYEDELDRAVTAVEKRAFDLSQDAGRRKALQFLYRRGFESELAYEAIRKMVP